MTSLIVSLRSSQSLFGGVNLGQRRIAALMQVLIPESSGLRLGLVKYLSTVPHVDATKALARLAIFSTASDTAVVRSIEAESGNCTLHSK